MLPLVIDDQSTGFVALSATNLEPCAVIAHHLAAALRTSRLYQDALLGRRQAEEASRLKNRFLAMVSHELRAPLSLIVGLSDMVLREHGDTLKQFGAALRDIDHIHASAQHLGRLIGDVLDLTSSEAGQLHLIPGRLDLAEVLRGVAALGEQMVRNSGLAWRMSLPAHGPQVWRSNSSAPGRAEPDQQCREIHGMRHRRRRACHARWAGRWCRSASAIIGGVPEAEQALIFHGSIAPSRRSALVPAASAWVWRWPSSSLHCSGERAGRALARRSRERHDVLLRSDQPLADTDMRWPNMPRSKPRCYERARCPSRAVWSSTSDAKAHPGDRTTTRASWICIAA